MVDRKIGFQAEDPSKDNGGKIVVASNDPSKLERQLREALDLARSQEGSPEREMNIGLIDRALNAIQTGREVVERMEDMIHILRPDEKKPNASGIGFLTTKK